MLTETQKAQIRMYLGCSDYWHYKHTRLESVLNNISPESETLIVAALDKLATVEAAIMSSGVAGAGIKRVDEVWFENGSKSVDVVRKTGRQWVGRISIILGVPIYSDIFGTAGYLGDSFSGLGGRSGGGGGWYGLG